MRRFPVSEAKERTLDKRMEALGIFESEIEESFVSYLLFGRTPSPFKSLGLVNLLHPLNGLPKTHSM